MPSARMSHSMPASSVSPRAGRSTARMRAACASARALVEAVGHRQRLAVIGDRDVVVAARAAAARAIVSSVVAAVGRGRCACGRSPRRSRATRRGAAARRARAASISPRFSRSSGGTPGQAERLVDALLGLARHASLPVDVGTARTRSASSRAASARSRSAMLWAFDPVKYCSAAPRLSGGTSRRSAWKPPRSSTLDLVSPRPSTRSTSG